MCVDKNNKAGKKNDGSKQAIRTNGCCGCGNSSYAHFELLDNQKMILLGLGWKRRGFSSSPAGRSVQHFELRTCAHNTKCDQN